MNKERRSFLGWLGAALAGLFAWPQQSKARFRMSDAPTVPFLLAEWQKDEELRQTMTLEAFRAAQQAYRDTHGSSAPICAFSPRGFRWFLEDVLRNEAQSALIPLCQLIGCGIKFDVKAVGFELSGPNLSALLPGPGRD